MSQVQYIYFLGIGGIGMSALARYFHVQGKQVSGYDKTSTPLTQQLEQEGMAVHYQDDLNLVHEDIRNMANKAQVLVVYTPAIPKDHSEYNFFLNNGYTLLKRSQLLGNVTEQAFCIGVAGTHGKTTTSTLIAHLLRSGGIDCSAFLGGISANYNTNLLLGTGTHNGKQVVVVEADEFDRSFLTLSPDIAVITSTDADHLDIYGEHEELKKSFLDYSNKLKSGGHLYIKAGLPVIPELKVDYIVYSLNGTAAVNASHVNITDAVYTFDLHINGKTISQLTLGIPGWHNVENAVVSSAVVLQMGVSEEDLRKGLATFRGAKRRFEYILRKENITYIDDYAHHPEEIKAFLSSVKEMYPDKKVTAVFQPHLFTRTRDFADGFAQSLSLADELILLDIYPARELPIPGVTSQMLLDKATLKNKTLCSKAGLLDLMRSRHPEVLVTIGAGDIDQLVEPLKHLYG
ncbi:MAG: UDP-N-acetylmuramate--L-alanine ligase [Bacteroidia bacterium]|nr:UDP-N-acetylmuramate--L-alanine ligase [Bacteroidia bacterium]MBP7260588.1 UDP-N-acetylmuramate--L-alanine ligase [Bacteroidia bacterium]MBP9179848.1 UDP-N-acetylmuramate--L-alanine ligase [Bacteroidia bacterium]MBP9724210.1 UDP-N-acetylmuramate--L-alanine ligase [Bacteroidia bacterium]